MHDDLKRDERMLTPKEARFVAEYLADPAGSATQAALRAGYKSAQGLLKRPQISKELKIRMRSIMKKKSITGERVVAELAKIAFANVDDFVDAEYRVKAKPKRKTMAAVQEVTTDTVKDTSGEFDEEVKRVKIKMYSKLDALNQLGRHFNIFEKEVETLGGSLADRLERAHARLENGGLEPQAKGSDDG